jgi:hypothetical protein
VRSYLPTGGCVCARALGRAATRRHGHLLPPPTVRSDGSTCLVRGGALACNDAARASGGGPAGDPFIVMCSHLSVGHPRTPQNASRVILSDDHHALQAQGRSRIRTRTHAPHTHLGRACIFGNKRIKPRIDQLIQSRFQARHCCRLAS